MQDSYSQEHIIYIYIYIYLSGQSITHKRHSSHLHGSSDEELAARQAFT
jgi:hypothetical protein